MEERSDSVISIINNLEIQSTSSITTYHPSDDNYSEILTSMIDTNAPSSSFARHITEEQSNDSDYEIREILYKLFKDDKIVNIIFGYYI